MLAWKEHIFCPRRKHCLVDNCSVCGIGNVNVLISWQVSLGGNDGCVSGLTLNVLEDAFLRHFLGLTREQAIGVYDFYMLKTLRGPRLSKDSHISRKEFYFYWKAGFEMVWKRIWKAIFHFRSIHIFLLKPSVMIDVKATVPSFWLSRSNTQNVIWFAKVA